MSVKIAPFNSPLRWRIKPARGRGLSRDVAVAQAQANIQFISVHIIAELDAQLRSLPDLLSRGDEPIDIDSIYECCHRMASIAAVVGFRHLGDVALALCGLLDSCSGEAVADRFVIELYVAGLLRLREATDQDHPAVARLALIARMAKRSLAPRPSQGEIVRAIYISTATSTGAAFDNGALAIADSASARNAASGVTGMILAYNGWYLQFLEGEIRPTARLLASILFDTRHIDVTMVSLTGGADRRFPECPMWMTHLDEVRTILDAGMRKDFDPRSLRPKEVWQLMDGIARLKGR